jgi:Peptidase family M28/PDZ domain
MLKAAKKGTLAETEKAIDGDLKPRSVALDGWTATLDVVIARPSIAAKNIIGTLEGAGPLANEIVVIGAHYDHLGFGGPGSKAKGKTIHPGADDNGSGTTSVMELARRFGAIKNRQGRRLVFMLFSGEERGLLGSAFYCNKEPLFPLESTVAMVNLDMVGRLNDKTNFLKADGVGSAKEWEPLVDKLNADIGFNIEKSAMGLMNRSDLASFYRKGVPCVFYWTGFHEDYHQPTDTADKININGMLKVVSLTEKTLAHLTVEPKRYEYQVIPQQKAPGGKGGAGGGAAPEGPRLRIGLNYADAAEKGVLIEFLAKGGPAEKGGMKEGDRIIAVAGKATPNINSYMAAMAQQKANAPLEVTVNRAGKELKLTITPE